MNLIEQAEKIRKEIYNRRLSELSLAKQGKPFDSGYLRVLRLYQKLIENQIEQLKC